MGTKKLVSCCFIGGFKRLEERAGARVAPRSNFGATECAAIPQRTDLKCVYRYFDSIPHEIENNISILTAVPWRIFCLERIVPLNS